MTEDIHEGDSLQEAHEIFASICATYPAKWVPWSLETAENVF